MHGMEVGLEEHILKIIHDVDDRIRLFVLHIAAGDALLGRERRHRICARQVNRDQLRIVRIVLLNQAFLLVHGNAGPVAHALISTGQRIEHGGLAAVRISRKRNSHVGFPSDCVCWFMILVCTNN